MPYTQTQRTYETSICVYVLSIKQQQTDICTFYGLRLSHFARHSYDGSDKKTQRFFF